MKIKFLFASALFALSINQVSAQYLKNQDYINSMGVSNTGKISIYNSYAESIFLWNPDANITTDIGAISPGNGYGGLVMFSDDSNYTSGTSIVDGSGNIAEMSKYNMQTQQWQTLGRLGGTSGVSAGSGYDISGDGNTIVGISYDPVSKKAVGTVWNGTNLINLGTLNPNRQSRALSVSRDGSVVVGGQDTASPFRGIVWRKNSSGTYDGSMLLIDPNLGNADSNTLGEARVVSGDGKWIGGGGATNTTDAYLWNSVDGAIILKNTLVQAANSKGYVTGINYDGSIAVGFFMYFQNLGEMPQYVPFIWTKQGGLKNLNTVVKDELKFDLKGDIIQGANDISANGKYITATSHVSGRSSFHTSRIQLPENFLAIQQQEVKANEIKLYPNPVKDYLNIDSKDKIETIKIYNTVGQLISQPKITNNKVSLSNLSSGVYHVNVTTKNGTKSYKIIKK